MSNYIPQIQHIKNKLQKAKELDGPFKVFGAGNHRYEINPPVTPSDMGAFEKE